MPKKMPNKLPIIRGPDRFMLADSLFNGIAVNLILRYGMPFFEVVITCIRRTGINDFRIKGILHLGHDITERIEGEYNIVTGSGTIDNVSDECLRLVSP